MIDSTVGRVFAASLFLGAIACADAKRSTIAKADTTVSPGASISHGGDAGPTVTAKTAEDSSPATNVKPGDAGSPKAASDASSAADVVRRYYDEINGARYDSAYALWDGSGKASGKSRAQFASGFAQTKRATVAVGDSVRIEGAAGSQYATVPVTVEAIQRDGTTQHFSGTYTLRRSMVDGATPAQRSWHIYSAHLQQR